MLSFKQTRQMKRTILFIVYDIVFHIERKINYFIYFYFIYLFTINIIKNGDIRLELVILIVIILKNLIGRSKFVSMSELRPLHLFFILKLKNVRQTTFQPKRHCIGK
jgi:hypothetical protein